MGFARRSFGLAACALVLTAGVAAAAGNPYPPPSQGSARVDPSRIKVGECAVFSGDGFAAVTPVSIADNGASDGTVMSTTSGTFSKKLCYTSDATRGRHTLTGSGTGADGSPLTVSAVLIVEGVRQSANNPATAPGGGANQPAGGANQPGSGSTQPVVSVGGTTGAVEQPLPLGGPKGVSGPPAAEGGSGLSGTNGGLLALALTYGALGLAFVSSLFLLLLLRRRRRREPDEDLATAAPA